MSQPFDKFTAIQLAEKIAYKEQEKFTELGYKPFMFLVDFDYLQQFGYVGCYHPTTDTVCIDIDCWNSAPIGFVLDLIQHEMVHMYIDRYHHHEATHAHGQEFHELYEKITGRPYRHYASLNTVEDRCSPRPDNWEVLVNLGTIRV